MREVAVNIWSRRATERCVAFGINNNDNANINANANIDNTRPARGIDNPPSGFF